MRDGFVRKIENKRQITITIKRPPLVRGSQNFAQAEAFSRRTPSSQIIRILHRGLPRVIGQAGPAALRVGTGQGRGGWGISTQKVASGSGTFITNSSLLPFLQGDAYSVPPRAMLYAGKEGSGHARKRRAALSGHRFFSLWRSSGRFWGCSPSGGTRARTAGPCRPSRRSLACPFSGAGGRSLLLAVADERPAFVLVRLDGAAPACRLIVVPGESVVLDGQGQPITLAESYAAAGPARAGSLLAATLGIQLDRYLAATPAVRGQSLSGLEQARVNLSPLLDEAARRALGVAAVAQLDAGEAASLLGDGSHRPGAGAAKRLGWQAFALQCQGSLAESVPQGLRQFSGDLLTDLTALDLEELGRVLAQLADA